MEVVALHVHNTPKLKTATNDVQQIHAILTKSSLFRVHAKHAQVILLQTPHKDDAKELPNVVQERDSQINHAFLVIHTQELKIVTHSVQQTLVQAITELTLMVNVLPVPSLQECKLMEELVDHLLVLEDKFLKEMAVAENVWSTLSQIHQEEIASAKSVIQIPESTDKEYVKYAHQDTYSQLTRDSASPRTDPRHLDLPTPLHQLKEDSRMLLWLVSVHLIDF